MESRNYTVCRDDIFVGSVVKTDMVVRCESDIPFFDVQPGKLDTGAYKEYRSMLFVPDRNNFACDLLYNSPNYTALNVSDDAISLATPENSIVVKDWYNLEELLRYFGYPSELTYEDIVKEFVEEFKAKEIHNTRADSSAVLNYVKGTLEIKTYLPFREKRAIVEMVVEKNISEVDGIKKIDAMDEYIAFVMSMITAHTNLQCSEDPVADYDLLAESGLLPVIIETFKDDYNECDVLLKMERASELEDNNVNVLIGKFLDKIIKTISNVTDKLNIKDIISENDLAKLSSFLDTYNK